MTQPEQVPYRSVVIGTAMLVATIGLVASTDVMQQTPIVTLRLVTKTSSLAFMFGDLAVHATS